MTDPKQAFNEVFQLEFPSVNSFREAKALYEKTKALQGKRKRYDIRPVAQNTRRHTRFQIHKISNDEYSLVCNYANHSRSLKYRLTGASDAAIETEMMSPDARRMLSFMRNGEIRIHTPIGRRMFVGRVSSDTTVINDGPPTPTSTWTVVPATLQKAAPTNQIWNFLSQVLPASMHIETMGRWKNSRKTYLAIRHADQTRYYYLPHDAGDYTMRLRKKKGEWRVMNPIQEWRQHLPKALTDRIRRVFRKFWPYAETYWQLAPETDVVTWQNHSQILQQMEDEPWDALCTLKMKVRRNKAILNQAESIAYWKKRLRQDSYQALDHDEYTYVRAPIGEKCSPPRYKR